MLEHLQEHQLAIASDRCERHRSRVNFLGYKISPEGVEIYQEKIRTVVKSKAPDLVKGVQSFLGFANFYRRFIEGYSMLTHPLTDLTKKSEKFFWSDECGRAFEELKQRFTSAPILRHYDPELHGIIECDASDFAIGSVLLQEFKGRLHPVAFQSRKMNKHDINYEIHDQELLAITAAFKEWRRYLEGARHKISGYTDHHGLGWITQNKPLNQRQARWALELDGFDFHIIYRPGVKNTKPDALSRCAEHYPEMGEHDYQLVEHVLKPGQWVPGNYGQIVLSSVQYQGLRPVVKISKWLEAEIVSKAKSDSIWQELYDNATEDGALVGRITALVTYKDGMLFRKGKVWIPNDPSLRKLIMESEHGS